MPEPKILNDRFVRRKSKAVEIYGLENVGGVERNREWSILIRFAESKEKLSLRFSWESTTSTLINETQR